LKKENAKPELRMVTPKRHIGNSKLSWVTFYNEEAERVLNACLQADGHKVFRISNKTFKNVWKEAQEKTFRGDVYHLQPVIKAISDLWQKAVVEAEKPWWE